MTSVPRNRSFKLLRPHFSNADLTIRTGHKYTSPVTRAERVWGLDRSLGISGGQRVENLASLHILLTLDNSKPHTASSRPSVWLDSQALPLGKEAPNPERASERHSNTYMVPQVTSMALGILY